MNTRYVPIAAVTALLTATPIVAQPQTTTDHDTTVGADAHRSPLRIPVQRDGTRPAAQRGSRTG